MAVHMKQFVGFEGIDLGIARESQVDVEPGVRTPVGEDTHDSADSMLVSSWDGHA